MRCTQHHWIVVLGMILSGLWIVSLSFAQESSDPISITVKSNSAINVRPQPNTFFPAVGSVRNGDEIHLIEMIDDGQAVIDNTTIWYQIEFEIADESVIGWVHASLLQVTQDKIDQLVEQQIVETTPTPPSDAADEDEQPAETFEMPTTIGDIKRMDVSTWEFEPVPPVAINPNQIIQGPNGPIPLGMLTGNESPAISIVYNHFNLSWNYIVNGHQVIARPLSGIVIGFQETENFKTLDLAYLTPNDNWATVSVIIGQDSTGLMFPIKSNGEPTLEELFIFGLDARTNENGMFPHSDRGHQIEIGDQVVIIYPDAAENPDEEHIMVQGWDRWRPEGVSPGESLAIGDELMKEDHVHGIYLLGLAYYGE